MHRITTLVPAPCITWQTLNSQRYYLARWTTQCCLPKFSMTFAKQPETTRPLRSTSLKGAATPALSLARYRGARFIMRSTGLENSSLGILLRVRYLKVWPSNGEASMMIRNRGAKIWVTFSLLSLARTTNKLVTAADLQTGGC